MRRAFTLFEVLITVALFGLVLIIVSSLLAGYQRILRHGTGKLRSLMAAQMVLTELRDELRGATRVIEPAGSTVTLIELEKIRPEVARLPAVVPQAPPASWNPNLASHLLSLRYERQGDVLMRRTLNGPNPSSLPMASGITLLQARLDNGLYEITLEVQENERVRRLQTRVARW